MRLAAVWAVLAAAAASAHGILTGALQALDRDSGNLHQHWFCRLMHEHRDNFASNFGAAYESATGYLPLYWTDSAENRRPEALRWISAEAEAFIAGLDEANARLARGVHLLIAMQTVLRWRSMSYTYPWHAGTIPRARLVLSGIGLGIADSSHIWRAMGPAADVSLQTYLRFVRCFYASRLALYHPMVAHSLVAELPAPVRRDVVSRFNSVAFKSSHTFLAAVATLVSFGAKNDIAECIPATLTSTSASAIPLPPTPFRQLPNEQGTLSPIVSGDVARSVCANVGSQVLLSLFADGQRVLLIDLLEMLHAHFVWAQRDFSFRSSFATLQSFTAAHSMAREQWLLSILGDSGSERLLSATTLSVLARMIMAADVVLSQSSPSHFERLFAVTNLTIFREVTTFLEYTRTTPLNLILGHTAQKVSLLVLIRTFASGVSVVGFGNDNVLWNRMRVETMAFGAYFLFYTRNMQILLERLEANAMSGPLVSPEGEIRSSLDPFLLLSNVESSLMSWFNTRTYGSVQIAMFLHELYASSYKCAKDLRNVLTDEDNNESIRVPPVDHVLAVYTMHREGCTIDIEAACATAAYLRTYIVLLSMTDHAFADKIDATQLEQLIVGASVSLLGWTAEDAQLLATVYSGRYSELLSSFPYFSRTLLRTVEWRASRSRAMPYATMLRGGSEQTNAASLWWLMSMGADSTGRVSLTAFLRIKATEQLWQSATTHEDGLRSISNTETILGRRDSAIEHWRYACPEALATAVYLSFLRLDMIAFADRTNASIVRECSYEAAVGLSWTAEMAMHQSQMADEMRFSFYAHPVDELTASFVELRIEPNADGSAMPRLSTGTYASNVARLIINNRFISEPIRAPSAPNDDVASHSTGLEQSVRADRENVGTQSLYRSDRLPKRKRDAHVQFSLPQKNFDVVLYKADDVSELTAADNEVRDINVGHEDDCNPVKRQKVIHDKNELIMWPFMYNKKDRALTAAKTFLSGNTITPIGQRKSKTTASPISTHATLEHGLSIPVPKSTSAHDPSESLVVLPLKRKRNVANRKSTQMVNTDTTTGDSTVRPSRAASNTTTLQQRQPRSRAVSVTAPRPQNTQQRQRRPRVRKVTTENLAPLAQPPQSHTQWLNLLSVATQAGNEIGLNNVQPGTDAQPQTANLTEGTADSQLQTAIGDQLAPIPTHAAPQPAVPIVIDCESDSSATRNH